MAKTNSRFEYIQTNGFYAVVIRSNDTFVIIKENIDDEEVAQTIAKKLNSIIYQVVGR